MKLNKNQNTVAIFKDFIWKELNGIYLIIALKDKILKNSFSICLSFKSFQLKSTNYNSKIFSELQCMLLKLVETLWV